MHKIYRLTRIPHYTSHKPLHISFKNMTMRNLVAALLLTFSAMAQAEPIEVWECRNQHGLDPILVSATVEEGRKEGSISVAGVTHVTEFKVAGFQRRWDFGAELDGSYKYCFTIQPDGEANYYEFGSEKTAKPTILMRCRLIPAGKASKAPK